MPNIKDVYSIPPELVLGTQLNDRVPEEDQIRQRIEVEELLRRLQTQPGVILGDEVGMGKTFVALAVAYCVSIHSPRGPVIVMVPSHLIKKWEQDLVEAFCPLYLNGRHPVKKDDAIPRDLIDETAFRYGVARHSVELMKLLDDPSRERCHLIFLSHGAMSRSQTDMWIRLALIAETFRRHGRGRAKQLILVKKNIFRFMGELLKATGEQKVHDLGEELWQRLLRTDPLTWKDIYNSGIHKEQNQMKDDPVPKAVVQAMNYIDLSPLAEALEHMPIRKSHDDKRLSERLNIARKALRHEEGELWKNLLANTRWRSPLLIMDEAHHLKNPGTALARQLQSQDSVEDLRTGDGAMAKSFDRMLFLTATPFQLGHYELVQVLKRFGDVRWDDSAELGNRATFLNKMDVLWKQLDESQLSAQALQRSWSRLRPEDTASDVESWWAQLISSPRETLTSQQRAVVDTYIMAKQLRDATEEYLRPWIVRQIKPAYWPRTQISRRQRMDGAAIVGEATVNGLSIPPQQLLPFFLAARSTSGGRQDLLGEALCSSYAAFRDTREKPDKAMDNLDDPGDVAEDYSHSDWYLGEFDRVLEKYANAIHPKVSATVGKVVDLWEAGEKVLVFAFYIKTCSILVEEIGREIEQRMMTIGQKKLMEAGRDNTTNDVQLILERIRRRYFDDIDSPGRRALDVALGEILQTHERTLNTAGVSAEQRKMLMDVMRRFLRVETTLVRYFPIDKLETVNPKEAIATTLNYTDVSTLSWQQKFDSFITFLTKCSPEERESYLTAARSTQTGGIRTETGEEEDGKVVTLANVRVVTGNTRDFIRERLMRCFNTPFFPDILVCSQVMGEGVDLQRFCRHVIHHDLSWNPSTIEQRIGRIDRLGCKAEGRQSIVVYLPYLSGTADERQYKVMSDRAQWFRVVMGQDKVAELITPDSSDMIQLPKAISDGLSFKLDM
jgi:hypothetical protein